MKNFAENRSLFVLLEPNSIVQDWRNKIKSSQSFEGIDFLTNKRSNIFCIQYDENYDNEITIDLTKTLQITNKNLKLLNCILRISNFGFANLLSNFEYSGKINQSDMEEAVDSTISDVDKILPIVAGILINLMNHNIVRHASTEFLQRQELADFLANNCLLNAHFFVSKDCVNGIEIESNNKEDLLGNTCHILSGAYIYLWEFSDDASAFKVFGIDFYSLTESLLIKSSVSIYSKLMGQAEITKVSSKTFRDTYNYLTRLLSTLALIEFDLSSEQRKFLQTHRNLSNISHRNTQLNDTKQAAQFIIEGIEAERNQQTGNKIQFILAIFTGITVYSVANDVISILNSNSLFIETIMDKKLSILGGLTFMIISAIWIFKRKK